MEGYEVREYAEEDENILYEDDKYADKYGEQRIMEFGGLILGEIKGVSRKYKTENHIFVDNSLKALNLLNNKCKYNLKLSDINGLVTRCQIINDRKFKSFATIFLSIKYNNPEENKALILKCAESLKISLFDIIRYTRLLKKYNIY